MLLPYSDPDRKRGKRPERIDWKKLPRWARYLLRLLGESPYGPLPEPGRYRWWGDIPLDGNIADELWYLLIGSIGSGKSTLLKALLWSIIPSITTGSDKRMLIYDPKPPGDNVLSAVFSMDPQVEVVILTPSDVRSPRVRFNWGGPAEIRQLWKNLAPVDPQEKNKFFDRGVQKIGTGVTEALALSGIEPTLELVCMALRDQHAVIELLGRHEHTRSKLSYVANERVWLDMLATIEDKLDDLLVMAAYGYHSSWEWGVSEFLRGRETIAFLGADTRIEAAQSIMRRIIYKELTQEILALGKDPSGRRRIFLPMEEMHTLASMDEPAPVPGMEMLATLARAMGAVLIAVLQHLGMLQACYGEDRAKAIIDQFGNRGYLKANGSSLDQWACREFGTARWVEWDVTDGYGPKGERSRSFSRKIVDRQLLPDGTFSGMTKASPQTGIGAWWVSPLPGFGIYPRVIHPAFVDGLPKNHPYIELYLGRPVAHQFLPTLDHAAVGLQPPKMLPDAQAEANARAEGKRRAARRKKLKQNHWQPGNYPVNVFGGLPSP
jgi:hypothetical protein